MKLKPLIEKLNGSKEYKEFAEKNKEAFVIAGFFVIDFELGKHVHQIDYYIPSDKKVAAFTLDDTVKMQTMTMLDDKVPEKLDIKTNIDLDELHGIIQDEMRNRSMTEEIKKIIAVLSMVKGKKIWNLNCVLSGMELLRSHVEDKSKTVLSMDKLSILELIKKVPAGAAQMALNQGGNPQAGVAAGAMAPNINVEKQIANLDKLKKALIAEEKALKKAEKKPKAKKK